MKSTMRRRPSPAIVIAVLALVAALAGTAIAGPPATTSIGKNQTKKIARQQAKKISKRQDEKQDNRNFPVDSSQIEDGAVTSEEVADGSLGTSEFAGSIPAARVTHSADQSVDHSSSTLLSFDEERFDSANLHDNSVNNSRLTAQVDGVYSVAVNVFWEASATGTRNITLAKNGGLTVAAERVNAPSTGFTMQSFSTMVKLEAGDHISVFAFQDSGSTLSMLGSGQEFIPGFSMTWVAPG